MESEDKKKDASDGIIVTPWFFRSKWGFFLMMGVSVGWIIHGCGPQVRNLFRCPSYNTEAAVFARGMAAYEQGAITLARADFHALAEDAVHPALSRDARLGTICCDLLLADTSVAYDRAIDLWYGFMKTVGENGESLNPRLIAPLVSRMVPENLLTTAASGEISGSVQAVQTIHHINTEMAALKKKVIFLQRQMADRRADNQALQEKIKALESIDQNIQKKKMGLAVPDE